MLTPSNKMDTILCHKYLKFFSSWRTRCVRQNELIIPIVVLLCPLRWAIMLVLRGLFVFSLCVSSGLSIPSLLTGISILLRVTAEFLRQKPRAFQMCLAEPTNSPQPKGQVNGSLHTNSKKAAGSATGMERYYLECYGWEGNRPQKRRDHFRIL